MKKFRANFLGFIILFLTITIVSSLSILVFTLISEKSNNNKSIISTLMFVLILFFTAICFVIDLFRRKFTVDSPVQQILDATKKITAGDFSVRLIPYHSMEKYNELDIIMLHLNKMTEELSKQELLNNNFIANISHEIKTPLAIIQNYCTALQNTELKEEEKNEYISVLIETTKKLTNLVTNILKLNKLENQVIEPNIQKFDITETTRECVLGFIEKIEKQKIELTLELDDIIDKTDKGLYEIAINNLISNAVKFTKSKIFISLKKESNFIIFKIKDDGIGMEKKVGVHIFDKFYQGETSHSGEGNGLGLSLVKKVVEILCGEISVSSELEKGSEFTLKLKRTNYE